MSKGLDKVIKIIDATAFEKDKTYLIKIDCGDLTTEACERTLQSIRDIFSNKGIDVIVYPNRIKIEASEIKKENDFKNIVDFITLSSCTCCQVSQTGF